VTQSEATQQAVTGIHCVPHGLNPGLHAMPQAWLLHTALPSVGVGHSETSQQPLPAMHSPLQPR